LIFCGRSHSPRAPAISGVRLVIDPSSIWMQAYDDHPFYHTIENRSPHARYAICEKSANGWNVARRCVDYDFAKASMTAKRIGNEDWARWLATGRAMQVFNY
jgi:hypothetical protein